MKGRTERLRAPRHPGRWLQRHLQTALGALGRIWRRPLANGMSLLVIAIALALPTGLHLVVKNLRQLGGHWEGAAGATLFLERDLNAGQIQALLDRLTRTPGVARLRHLTPDQALADFRAHSDLDDALDLLDENPLPHVVLIESRDAAGLAHLLDQVRRWPGVERASADLAWVERFQALVDLIQRAAWLLAGFFGLAVLLVIGNTIRLEIQSRREEIAVIKLVGGSDAFVRRPFLYEGFWYGLLGGLGALVLVSGALWLLTPAINRLARLYGGGFQLSGLELTTGAVIVAGGALLGVLGAGLAVAQTIRAIEPA